ncbi:hypothetical protein HYPSUDRAFT_146188 [Hypholoma sublateritium FD-334 SS-4]|uniref:Histone-lysine N-methyltransferase n=1 Tax=Hypholoma sublateritium (strain FD-334 SS-4) TaxID=945553 RepID=A0A0D2NFG6_HYPSF|nr:hypothetical protein HYPSUDRAFT_146188 [Hypholoma sublateritium FD-334 SS-4]
MGTAIFPPRKTYGGFRAITLKDHVTEQKTYLQHCKHSRDLPHIFQDYVNDMPMYLRALPEMRRVFEAMIMENTVRDEPDAPKIEVQNDVDNEPTPPWEFYYSNEMWLGEGVPRPDIDNLVRCSCKGACNPKSKTCACLKRQRDACQDPNLEFAYDKTGKLKIPGYPIFECNDLCGCGDECRNRVVQHGRKVSVSIKKTHLKGWGVFATKKILAGTFIGIYSGELITDVVAHKRGINYNKFGRTYLFDIDFHHLKDDDSNWNNKFTVDAYHAGNFTRFLNHSCDPNSRLFACYINEGNVEKPLLVIFSLRDIEANEEICFNYQGDYPGDDDESRDGEGNEEGKEEGPSMAAEARDSIYQKCRCGARNCTGMFFIYSLVEDILLKLYPRYNVQVKISSRETSPIHEFLMKVRKITKR